MVAMTIKPIENLPFKKKKIGVFSSICDTALARVAGARGGGAWGV